MNKMNWVPLEGYSIFGGYFMKGIITIEEKDIPVNCQECNMLGDGGACLVPGYENSADCESKTRPEDCPIKIQSTQEETLKSLETIVKDDECYCIHCKQIKKRNRCFSKIGNPKLGICFNCY